jgi:hypothetical protein
MSDESKAAEADATTEAAATEAEAEAATEAEATTQTEGEGSAEPAADTSKPAAASEADDDAVLDARGRERPRFLLAFPADPDLQRLSAAFEAGNYALVRSEAEALAERTENPAVRDAALELRRRIDPDPLAKYLLALTAALLLSLAYFAYHH